MVINHAAQGLNMEIISANVIMIMNHDMNSFTVPTRNVTFNLDHHKPLEFPWGIDLEDKTDHYITNL